MHRSARRLLIYATLALLIAGAFPGRAGAQQDSVVAVIARQLGSFTDAKAFSISADERITVIDGGTGNLIMLDANGRVERTLNGKGWGELGFDQPNDVDATQTIRIYVADYGNHRIQIFDKNFNFITTLDGQLPSDDSFQFRYPRSVAVSRHNDIFVLDGDNARIVKLDASGTVAATFGGFDAGKGRLEAPSRIRLSMHDVLGVVDGTDLVFFDLYGNFLTRYRNVDKIVGCAPMASSARWILASESELIVIALEESGCRLVGPVELRHDDGMPLKPASIRDIAFDDRNLYVLTNHDVERIELGARESPAAH